MRCQKSPVHIVTKEQHTLDVPRSLSTDYCMKRDGHKRPTYMSKETYGYRSQDTNVILL